MSNGTITEKTAVSLKLIIPFCVFIVTFVVSHLDNKYTLKQIQADIIEIKNENWTRSDDQYYMNEIIAENGLIKVPHKKLAEWSSSK